MSTVSAALVIGLMALSLLLHIPALPANWVVIALVVAWKLFHPAMAGWDFIVLLVALAGLGELVEFVAQWWSLKKYGGSNKASWWSIIGAIGGAIVCAPIAFGLGALPGAFGGAWLGAYLAVVSHGKSRDEALRSAKGALFGRVLGLIAKVGLGVTILQLAAPRIWPG